MLNPRESGAWIATKTRHVKLRHPGVDAAVDLIVEKMKSGDVEDTDWLAQKLHPKSRDAAAANWVLFVDALNFSFWSEEGEKWVVTYKGTPWTGYFAACACVNRALDRGIPITDPKHIIGLCLKDVRAIFVDDRDTPIPLLSERRRILQETALILLDKFGGSFLNCVEECGNSAVRLLELVVSHFPSFRDEAEYEGSRVCFYKRAQILVADIWRALELPFADIDVITAFADYRVPQVLAYLGALEYDEELRRLLESKELLLPGDPMEVELRGLTIHACELITKKLRERLEEMGDDRPQCYAQVNSIVVDNFLWCFRRTKAAEIESKVPYHRTRGIYY